MNNIILITKDALNRSYLPTYGNKFHKTPHIADLATKGTVFQNHYTTAPSTAMSTISMFTGLFPFETQHKDYSKVKENFYTDTLFDRAKQRGYKSSIIWKRDFLGKAKAYAQAYGKETEIITYEDVISEVKKNGEEKNTELDFVENQIKKILEINNNFIWVHLPHVISGYQGYGSDIEGLDNFVGRIRKYFNDDNIFISADHGNMNGFKGKVDYGFDVYQPAILIPLITPKIENKKTIFHNTTNADLWDIIFNRKIVKREFIYSDSAYYLQSHRKLAIIYENFKYIYNKSNQNEELYDLSFDDCESVNLFYEKIYDKDRNRFGNLKDKVLYPNYNELDYARKVLVEEKKRIYRDGNFIEKNIFKTKHFIFRHSPKFLKKIIIKIYYSIRH